MAKSFSKTVYTNEDGTFEAFIEVTGGPGIKSVNVSAGEKGSPQVVSESAQPSTGASSSPTPAPAVTGIAGTATNGGPHGADLTKVNFKFVVTPTIANVPLTITQTIVIGGTPHVLQLPGTFLTDATGTYAVQSEVQNIATSITWVAKAPNGVTSTPATFTLP